MGNPTLEEICSTFVLTDCAVTMPTILRRGGHAIKYIHSGLVSIFQVLRAVGTCQIAPMKVLVACEFSGTVRDAFLRRGFDAWSCDLLPDERGSNRHIIGDARDILGDGWDLLIVAHPPCTRLCNSGVRWLHAPPKGRSLELMWRELDEGCDLFSAFWNAPIERICVENPVMHRHAKERIVNYREPAQSVQPWQFGHGETKRTCFWLKGLPLLRPTNIVDGREPRVHFASPSPDRWKERSRFFTGIADAMADQWGDYAAEMLAA